MRNRGAVFLLIASTVALLLVHLAWRSTPAVYDGLCINTPYQWLHPGPGQAGPAQGASKNVDVTGGQPSSLLLTNEPTPQAQLVLQQDSLDIPAGTTTITESITPVDPPQNLPSDGILDTNVYQITATAGGKELPIKPGGQVTVVLIATGATEPVRHVEVFDGKTWTKLPTDNAGGCAAAFVTDPTTWGEFAVFEQRPSLGAPAGPVTNNSGGIPPLAIVVLIIFACVGAVVVLMLALRRGRSSR